MRTYALAALLVGLAATRVGAEVLTVNPARDNTLYESQTDSLANGAGVSLFAGATLNQGLRRALLFFDVSDIPVDASVDSVKMTLHVSRARSGIVDMALHRVTQDWGEGASNAGIPGGNGAPAATGDATWIHRFFNSETWTTAGGDFDASVSATSSVGPIGTYTWGTTAQLVADVQSWVNGSATNFGWIVIGPELSRSAKRFDSREAAVVSVRPTLTVWYTPSVAVQARTWSASKSRYRE